MKPVLISLFLLILLFSMSFAADDGQWFDMEKCAMCKSLMEDPELMNNMTWKHHNISNGIVSVTKVDPAYLKSYLKSRVQMNEIGERIAKGEKFEFCNMCSSLGGLYQAGAKWEAVDSDNVMIGITTSDNPEIVEKIQAWAERTTKEMMAMEQTEHSEHQH